MSESPTPPSTPPVAGVRYSTRTRLAVVGALIVAVGAFVLAGMRTVTDEDPGFQVSGAPAEEVVGDEAIEALVPGEGDEVLGQQRIGVDLAPGWTGELFLLPAAGDAQQLPDDELERIPELNQIFYQPLPGKSVERLAGGTNCVSATIWNQVRGRAATERTRTWCFSVL